MTKSKKSSKMKRAARKAAMIDPTTVVASVGKALGVLEIFNQSRRKLTLTQIAEVADMELSTAQRFVNTLVYLRYLQKDPASRLYALSCRVLELGHHYHESNELIERATPHMLRLSKDTEETVNLSVLDEDDIVVVARFVSRNVVRPEFTVGARIPAFLSASGYVLLSGLDDKELRARLAASNAVDAITPEALLDRCHRVQSAGYSRVSDGLFQNDITIAAPIFDSNGSPHAALGFSISKLRWTPERAESELVPQLLEAARPISLVRPSASSKNRVGAA